MKTNNLWCTRMADTVIQKTPLFPFDWSYEQGVFLLGVERIFRVTGDRSYFEYIKRNMDRFVDPSGVIRGYRPEEFNIDNINNGKVLFFLLRETGEKKYLFCVHQLRQQMLRHPRTAENGFWHKNIYPHQMWLDGIYMGSPFLAEFAAVIGEHRLYDEVVHQVMLMYRKTHDAETGLLYHGYDDSRGMKWADGETGCSPHFWGRAMGWFVAAIVDILDVLPEDHAGRTEIIRVLRRTIASLLNVQTESGMWYQILNQADRPGNYPETSATSMFAYAILKGVRNGYLDASVRESAFRAMQAMTESFIREDSDGSWTLLNTCSVAGLGNNPYRDGSFDYYIGEPVAENDLKGVGAFIQAAVEWELSDRLSRTTATV